MINQICQWGANRNPWWAIKWAFHRPSTIPLIHQTLHLKSHHFELQNFSRMVRWAKTMHYRTSFSKSSNGRPQLEKNMGVVERPDHHCGAHLVFIMLIVDVPQLVGEHMFYSSRCNSIVFFF